MTKKDILRYLEQNLDNYVSGAYLASELNISRAAIWKSIRQLKAEGYVIDSVTNRGYRLSSRSDVLSADGIKKYLRNSDKNIVYFPVTGSTNTELKAMAQNGAPEGTIVIAAEQTAGRGRMGRKFYSPSENGIYMSILLRPSFSAEKALKITACTAVAAACAIEKITGEKTEIKWVNDILLNGKKVCGILTEAALNCESGGMDYIIVGIGINVSVPSGGYPAEISEIAGALFTEKNTGDTLNRLAAAMIDEFFHYCSDLESDEAYNEYCRRSCVTGKNVNLISFGGETQKGFVESIDKEFALIVKLDDGSVKRVNSGEVSLRVV